MIVKTVGERIRYLRTRIHLTQAELAELLRVSPKTISSWESDRTEPSIFFILGLSKYLGVSIQYLLTGEQTC